MHVYVTGYADTKANKSAQKKNNAAIRLVIQNDKDDDVQVISGNTDALGMSLYRLTTDKFLNYLEQYGIKPNNINLENNNGKKPAALRFDVPLDTVGEFLNATPFWSTIGKLLANKNYKLDDGSSYRVNIPFLFNQNTVLTQMEKSHATQEDYKQAVDTTSNFIYEMLQNYDKEEYQAYLQHFLGSIKFVQSESNGWEFVQLSEKNSLLVLAQYLAQGITPTFVCNARDWMVYFNRTLKPNAHGAVIEVPLNNKRRDDNAYSDKTGGRQLSQDLAQGGSTGYLAQWVGFNQHDLESNMYPGWVFDVSETELINGMPDNFNDTSQLRRKTNIGNDMSVAFSDADVTDVSQYQNADNNGEDVPNSPFTNNSQLISTAIKNIYESIVSSKKFVNAKGMNKYANALPLIKTVMAKDNPTVNEMAEIVKALADCDLYQIENVKQKKLGMERIVASVILAKCGFGTDSQQANYARQIIQNKEEALKLADVISNIAKLINGTMIQKMNENKILNEIICKPISFDELVQELGIEDIVYGNNSQQETLQEIKSNFFKTLNKLNRPI